MDQREGLHCKAYAFFSLEAVDGEKHRRVGARRRRRGLRDAAELSLLGQGDGRVEHLRAAKAGPDESAKGLPVDPSREEAIHQPDVG